ncbi:MAG: recombinase RecA [Candidatus Bipolaricaulota bacterium]|nr:recombinase RecA [Candidatus Bipolaricaulota bacterium]MCX7844148.1 recombinase RecA [Candidatus Bipolaricaulota bacterium]MDW8152263.1 recombinase RecA [Candidatus Bipolaricaulota bacterium]
MANPERKDGNPKRQEILENVIKQIQKAYGEGAIMRLGERPVAEVEVIPTGSLALDIALGVGGVPRGRIVEIFGPEASGKTTLALSIVAEAQRLGGTAAFIDAEHALDPGYCKAIGVDLDELLLSQPSSGEQALEIMEALVRSGAVDVIVVDSVAALVPEAELQGQMGEAQVGLQARLMSQAMRKLAAAIAQSKTVAVFVNQIRAAIQPGPFGPATTTTGGRALKFYASVRLNIWSEGKIAEGDERVGMKAHVRVVKSKVAPPYREASFDIIYGRGIVKERDILNTGVEWGVVTRAGAWYSYGDIRLGQGLAQAAQFLEEHPDLAQRIAKDIRAKAGIPEPKPLGE